MPVSESISELASLLAPGDHLFAERMAFAVAHPSDYLEQDRSLQQIFWDDDDAQREDFVWVAFLDGLSSRRFAWEFDWKVESPHEVIGCVLQLQGASQLSATTRQQLEQVLDDGGFDHRTLTVLLQVAKLVPADGMSLVLLEKNSDSHVVSLLPTDDLPKARRLAHGINCRIADLQDHAPPGH